MKALVAGIGNVLHRDDGFGSEVARRLADRPIPAGVRVEDYGLRGLHLALDLLEGYELLVLVDALAGPEAPGTVRLLEPDPAAAAGPLDPARSGPPRLDAQGVLRIAAELGGDIGRVIVVGCRPADIDEGVGLSGPVADAVERAVRMVEGLVAGGSTLPDALTPHFTPSRRYCWARGPGDGARGPSTHRR